jgi:hypothetical protein
MRWLDNSSFSFSSDIAKAITAITRPDMTPVAMIMKVMMWVFIFLLLLRLLGFLEDVYIVVFAGFEGVFCTG